ncbi:Fe-S-containing protein [Selenomonas sp. TAMA-11512]|uniref:DUF2318 domain-containing protein n=1 Tax=Selenomonas sp. TAMA-11512 TaxID=3095337 RepID=UPI003087500D|nr:Fe-S-containing protein [Selenomonas sp. TAMA-11512]
MLQTFLQTCIPSMEQVLTLGVPLGVLFATLSRLPVTDYQGTFKSALKWGFWLSIAIIAARLGTKNAVSRESIEMVAMAISIVSEIVLVLWLTRDAIHKEMKTKVLSYNITLLTIFLCIYHGIELWLIPVSTIIASAGDYYTTTMATKIAGFFGGTILGCIGVYVAYKAADALYYKRLLFVFIIQAAAMVIQQGIFLVQILMAKQILFSSALLSIMAPLIDNASWLIFIIFFGLLFVPLALFSQKLPAKLPEWNPAEYRKELIRAIHKRRWATATMAALVIMVLFSSLGSSYANKKEEIVPAVPVTAVDGNIDVDLNEVKDGHLHRFVYQTSDGKMVRYIVVLKGGNAYGVGLDACEICGATGYYEKDSNIICKLCDVQMNKATIGIPGGCNPIPIKYTIVDGKLRVFQMELEEKKKHFM